MTKSIERAIIGQTGSHYAEETTYVQDKKIGAKIKYLMSMRKITQYDLAAVIGKKAVTVSFKLGGKRRFTLKELKLIADYLNTTVDFFFSDELDATNVGRLDSKESEKDKFVGLYEMGSDRELHFAGTGKPVTQPDGKVVTERETDLFAVVVADESMEPQFFAGDILLLSGEAGIGKGDYVFYQTRGGEHGVRQVFYDKRKKEYTFKATNRLFPDKVHKREDVAVLCRVVERREVF